MQVPLQITCRGLDQSPSLNARIEELAEDLEKVCDHINSCRVAIEVPHAHPRSGSQYRVRLDIRVASGEEVVITRNEDDGNAQDNPHLAIHDAFERAKRHLRKVTEQQQGRTKRHPEQELAGVVERIFDDYGFIHSVDGRSIYFHRNSVIGFSFDELAPGAGVTFSETLGDKGPQASTVRVVDARRGHRGESLEA